MAVRAKKVVSATVTGSKPKRIVIFSDGTGNSAAALFKTNVRRLHEALDLSDPRQIAIYDDGVGSSSFRPWAAVSGALGVGLARNVRALYAFLCDNYNPGDEIHAFGFSRGAFTVRVLVGVIHAQGIIPKSRFAGRADLHRLTSWAYRNYRSKYKCKNEEFRSLRKLDAFGAARWLRNRILMAWQRAPHSECEGLAEHNHHPYDPVHAKDGFKVRFLGLWDTVDAYGLPIDELTRGWNDWVWPIFMRDQKVWLGVEKVCHALGLDDERNTFHPRLIDEEGGVQNSPAPRKSVKLATAHTRDERITQVWFAGMHADVGGGYANDGLSYVSLNWMVEEAKRAGLLFRKDALGEINGRADPLGFMNDSRSGVGGYYRYQPRKIPELINTQEIENAGIKIHHSVFDRIVEMGRAYAPIVLPETYSIVSNRGAILPLSAGIETVVTASQRKIQQEHVWDWVWYRRVTYFVTVFFTAILVAMPWLANVGWLRGIPILGAINDESKCVDSFLCFVSGLPGLLGSFLPGFLKTWTDTFSANPGVFLFLVMIIAALMLLGTWLKHKIHDRMSQIWHRGKNPPSINYTKLWALRTNVYYRGFFDFVKYAFLPTVFGMFMAAFLYLYLPYVTANRLWFALNDSMGRYCVPSAILEPVGYERVHDGKFAFDGSKLCNGTGLGLVDGATYEIVITPTPGEMWFDGVDKYRADTEGLIDSLPFPISAFGFLLKRDVGEGYMIPIARIVWLKNKTEYFIDRAGQDEYVLKPIVPKAEGAIATQLRTRFTASSTGELFLYLNDALVFWPRWFDAYSNNRARATVTVQRVRE